MIVTTLHTDRLEGFFHFDAIHGVNSICNTIFKGPKKCVFVRSVHMWKK